MKKIESIKLTPLDDKALLQRLFDEYFANPKLDTAIRLIYACGRQMMVGTSIDYLNLEFEKMNISACYSNRNIKISIKNLKKCKKTQYITEALQSLFHEFSHALIEERNKLFLATQDSKYPYVQPYFEGYFYNIFNKYMSGDLEVASVCAMYYYFFNQDENLARKFSSEMTQKYVDEFCGDKNLRVSTHKELNAKLIKNLSELSIDFRYNRDLPKIILDGYQKSFLEKLPGSVDKNDLCEFLYTCELKITPVIRKKLIDFCIETQDFDKTQMILSKPQITVTPQELDKLKSIYGENNISKLVFGNAKIVDSKQLSK